jgi:hypothetical protein
MVHRLQLGFRELQDPCSQSYSGSFETVSVNFLRISAAGMALLGCLAVEQFLDVSDWSERAPCPRIDVKPALRSNSRHVTGVANGSDTLI